MLWVIIYKGQFWLLGISVAQRRKQECFYVKNREKYTDDFGKINSGYPWNE